VSEFGIDTDNMFGFWDWVGGRYSMDSAIGLSTMLAIGPSASARCSPASTPSTSTSGAPDRAEPALAHRPAGRLVRRLLRRPDRRRLPYDQYLHRFPAYLQQLTMESNGKHVTARRRSRRLRDRRDLLGRAGTNGQHSFYQLIHQGRS
jgi:glucose-6-phosphate isomerase